MMAIVIINYQLDKEQINKYILNRRWSKIPISRIELRQSKVDRQGVFAIRDMKKGDLV